MLLAILTALCGWAKESAAAWLTAHSRRFGPLLVPATLIAAVGFAPALFASNIMRDLPVDLQVLFGPTHGESTLIGTWPAVRLVFVHDIALGVFDDVPAGAVAVAFACLFVALGAWIRRRGEPTPTVAPIKIVLTGLIAGAAAVGLGYVLMVWLRADIGHQLVEHALGYGLDYLTRCLDLEIVACAALAGVLGVRGATRVRYSSANCCAARFPANPDLLPNRPSPTDAR